MSEAIERIDVADEPQNEAMEKPKKPKQCLVDEWGVVGWIHPSKSEDVLKIVLKDKESGKDVTVGVFFPKEISKLYSRKIKAIPIKYKKVGE